MRVTQLRELGETAYARIGGFLARSDLDTHLVVALELWLGAAGPHDDPAAAGELEHEHVGRRKSAFPRREIDDLLDRVGGDGPRRTRAEARHCRADLREALGAGPRDRDLLGDEQADAAVDVVEMIEHGLAARAIP